jgi:hypothetical protein
MLSFFAWNEAEIRYNLIDLLLKKRLDKVAKPAFDTLTASTTQRRLYIVFADSVECVYAAAETGVDDLYEASFYQLWNGWRSCLRKR